MQTVPFFWVAQMSRSLDFYVGQLGFEIRMKWEPEGEIRWVQLEREGALLMLQEGEHSSGKGGKGVAIYFVCRDALAIYREISAKGVLAPDPQVGNGMWEFGLSDPDGYRIHFESPTNVPEETKRSKVRQ